MLVALVVVTPIAGWAALPALTDPVALVAGLGVGVCLVGDPVRLRPARDGAAGAGDLRAARLAAARDGDRDRHPRPRPVPTVVEVVGVALVVLGVAVHRERSQQAPNSPVSPSSSRIACDSAAVRGRQSRGARPPPALRELVQRRRAHARARLPALRSSQRSRCSSDRRKTIVRQVKPMSSTSAAPGRRSGRAARRRGRGSPPRTSSSSPSPRSGTPSGRSRSRAAQRGSRARPTRSSRTRSGLRPRRGAASRRRRTGSTFGSRSSRRAARAHAGRAGAGRRP